MEIFQTTDCFAAIAVLQKLTDTAYRGQVAQSIAIRDALKALHRGNDDALDDFWNTLADPMTWCDIETQRNYMRATRLQASIYRIARQHGFPDTPQFWESVRRG